MLAARSSLIVEMHAYGENRSEMVISRERQASVNSGQLAWYQAQRALSAMAKRYHVSGNRPAILDRDKRSAATREILDGMRGAPSWRVEPRRRPAI